MNKGDAGKRAAREIRQAVFEGRITLSTELDEIDTSGCAFWHWEHGKADPSMRTLQKMAQLGYDIVYIVTGVREAEPETARAANAYQRKKRKLVTR